MSFTLNGLNVSGIATCLPPRTLAVKDMAKDFGESDTAAIERIIESSGVKAVSVAGDKVCASDLCVQAAEHLIRQTGIDRTSIDSIVFVSQTPDYKLPATSVVMQHRLGLRKDVTAFDINYGCSAYIYGLFQAGALVASNVCNRVLVCVGDNITSVIHPKDRSARVLLGDAGAATIVERGESKLPFHFYTNGAGFEYLCIPAGGSRIPYSAEACLEQTDDAGNTRTLNNFYMNGVEVMQFALKQVPPSVEAVLVEAGMAKEDIDTFVFHQANLLILKFLIKKMKLPATNVPIALENTGNTGPASIPLALSLKAGELAENGKLNKVLLSGFGSGLSVASTIADLSRTLILPPCLYNPA